MNGVHHCAPRVSGRAERPPPRARAGRPTSVAVISRIFATSAVIFADSTPTSASARRCACSSASVVSTDTAKWAGVRSL